MEIKPRSYSLLVFWLAIGLVVSFLPIFKGGNWYPAAKYFSQFAIGGILLIGFVLGIGEFEVVPDKMVLTFRLVVLAGLYLFVGMFEVYSGKKEIEVYSYSTWARELEKLDKNSPLTIFRDREGEVLWFAEMVARDAGISILPISPAQVARLARQEQPVPPNCLSKGLPVLHDLSSWPHFKQKMYAVVGIHDSSELLLRSDQGFYVSVLNRETVANLGSLRIDRAEFGGATEFSFGPDSWAVGGVWSACVIPVNDHIVVTVDVPVSLVQPDPLDLLMQVGDEIKRFRIMVAGRHVLSMIVKNALDLPELVAIKSLQTWEPMAADPKSLDTRKLGVRVLTLGVGETKK